MAVLSKMAVQNIAEKMTKKSKDYHAKLEQELRNLLTEIYEEQIPEDVKKVFKKHPEYIETCTSVYLDGHGFNRETLRMSKSLPATSSYHQPLKLTSAIADRIKKVKNKCEKAEEDYEKLVQETQSALLALKTQKNIRENLPEAVPFLPPPMSNALVVNFTSLQKKLNSQPEEKKQAVTN